MFTPATSHAGWWQDIWKALYWLYYESVDHEARIQVLEEQSPTDCLIESERIGSAVTGFPRAVELNCFEETDILIVTTSGWYHGSGRNQGLTTTFHTE